MRVRSLAARALPLVATLLAAERATAQPARAPRPVAPWVVSGVCPFECCTYGRWRFVTGADVQAAPRTDAPVVVRIAPGSRVRADSGRVQVDTVGVVVVRRDWR